MSDFAPNDWNPNKMSPRDYALLCHDIQEFGFIDPLTVRPHPNGVTRFQIIDGENRWRAARDVGIDVTYNDLGAVPDTVAQKLTITLNELRGQYDPRSMGQLLEGLLAKESPAELLQTLPFTEEALAGMVGLQNFDWKGLDKPGKTEKPEKGEAKWVERTFRLPPAVNEVLNDALARAKKDNDLEDDFSALEVLAAEYLAS